MRVALVLAAVCGVAFVVVSRVEPGRAREPVAAPRLPPPVVRRARRRVRPKRTQFVVVSFDGSGGIRLWPYWRAVARRAHAHFTFFVSGVYLLDWAHSRLYRPPRHEPGRSDIGFAPSAEIGRAHV